MWPICGGLLDNILGIAEALAYSLKDGYTYVIQYANTCNSKVCLGGGSLETRG